MNLPIALLCLMPAGVEPEPAAAPRPLGWLSHPDQPAETFAEALTTGKVHLNNRLRIEFADTTARDSSTAITNRLRLGYETKPFFGFSGVVEMESVATPAEDAYWVPATSDGTPSRTVVADPPGTEVNQAYARFANDNPGMSFDIRAGRQRIKLDDDRFIGNIGWRQFEQTFDAASIRTNLGRDNVKLFYAYAWGVQRIFGPDGPNPSTDLHLINVSTRVAPELTVTPFAYFLDFGSDDPINSSNSFGVRLTGTLFDDPSNDTGTSADYEITYAFQSDAGSNPITYQAHFLAGQLRVNAAKLGSLFAGYQLLGSDDGAIAFRFPLGTNHKFQGFADTFLVTPNAGLQDAYLGVSAQLPLGIKASIAYHEFWSDQGSASLGSELDVVARRQITPRWSMLVKAGFFDGDNGQPDTTRLWAQTTLGF